MIERKKTCKKIHSKALLSRHFPNEKDEKIQGRERANTRVLLILMDDLLPWTYTEHIKWMLWYRFVQICPTVIQKKSIVHNWTCKLSYGHKKSQAIFHVFFLFIWKFLFSLQLDRRRDRLFLRFKLHIHIYSKSSYIRERQRMRMGEKREKLKVEQNQWTQLVARLLHNVNTHGYTSRNEKWWARKKK